MSIYKKMETRTDMRIKDLKEKKVSTYNDLVEEKEHLEYIMENPQEIKDIHNEIDAINRK
jgi:hypothetical protein